MKMDKMLGDRLVGAKAVAELLEISVSTAYKRIAKLNSKRKGVVIENGKIPLSFLKKAYGLE